MCRKTVWCYIIVLTLLDISLNTKLSAQGKSHGNGKIDYENGASVHESLMDGISLQDWGKESGGGTGRAAPAGVLALSPPALHFGHAALAVPHTLAVTITNTANETIHLASVAGSTPDFHASFFEAKTLGPLANTSFSVVFLGRREGPVRAALVLHTSRGAQRYSVGAVGVASAWRVWPLTGVRVPANCSVRAALTLYNPGPAAVQVSEVAASGAALALELPGAARAAPAAAWLLPPRATTHLVTLRLRPPPGAPPQPAYVRVRGNMTGGALVLCVEAAPAPPGDYLAPLQLRLAPRGSADPPDTFPLRAATSAPAPRPLQAAVLAAHCSPHAAPPLHAPALDDAPPNGAAAAAPGVRVALLRDQLEPHQEPTDTATLTLDYGAMWEQALSAGGGAHNGAGGGGGGGAGEAEGAWCGGWVRVGGAALPYSVRLVRGALRLDPPQLHFVSSDEAGLGAQTVSLHNELAAPLAVTHVDVPDEVLQHFEYSWLQPAPLAAGAAARVLRLRPRGARAPPLAAVLRVHTNLTHADLPLMLYSATLTFEWDWPGWEGGAGGAGGELQLGALGAGGARVAGRVLNSAPVEQCAALGARGAALHYTHCGAPHAELQQLADAAPGDCRCVPARGWRAVSLHARAPHAVLWARTPRGRAELRVRADPQPGDVRARDVLLPPSAPYVWSSAPLVIESSMAMRMRVLDVTAPPGVGISFRPPEEGSPEIGPGLTTIGSVWVAREEACGDACFSGPAGGARASLADDAALARRRRAAVPAAPLDVTLHVRTSRVLRLAARVSAPAEWPSLLRAAAPVAPRVAPVGGAAPLRLRLHNPSHRPLQLQAVLDTEFYPTGEPGEARGAECARCVWAAAAFSLREPAALVPPRAHLDLALTFTPHLPTDLAVYLYLRNNLTILERVVLSGRGAHPSFELSGRKPNSTAAISVEVSECGAGAARRALALRNTGGVPLTLRDWRVAGAPCAARGFQLQPCAPLTLAPNESRELTLLYAADWTQARAAAALSVRAGARPAVWQLHAATPPRLLRRCEAHARRPPFEAPLRALGAALALLALAGAAALAGVDAERALRRARAARPPHERGAALDLRALARAEPSAPAPAAPRRRRTPRRRAPALDPAAERRAFDRWRAGVERRAAPAPAADSRSASNSPSESGAAPERRASSSEPDSTPPPPDSYSDVCNGEVEAGEADEEGASTASESSGAGSDRSSDASGERAPPAPPRPRPEPAAPAAPPARPRPRPAAARRAARRRERAPSPARPPARAEPRAPPAVRWGASWSSVVSRGGAPAPPAPAPGARGPAPLAPIGSDVRRRLGSHSLFYYGTPAGGAGSWPPPTDAPPPLAEYLEWGAEERGESVWGSGGSGASAGAGESSAWLWGGGAAVRPPPGFPPPRPVRPYDPFHSLASIWTPAALDWRLDSPPPDESKDRAP